MNHKSSHSLSKLITTPINAINLLSELTFPVMVNNNNCNNDSHNNVIPGLKQIELLPAFFAVSKQTENLVLILFSHFDNSVYFHEFDPQNSYFETQFDEIVDNYINNNRNTIQLDSLFNIIIESFQNNGNQLKELFSNFEFPNNLIHRFEKNNAVLNSNIKVESNHDHSTNSFKSNPRAKPQGRSTNRQRALDYANEESDDDWQSSKTSTSNPNFGKKSQNSQNNPTINTTETSFPPSLLPSLPFFTASLFSRFNRAQQSQTDHLSQSHNNQLTQLYSSLDTIFFKNSFSCFLSPTSCSDSVPHKSLQLQPQQFNQHKETTGSKKFSNFNNDDDDDDDDMFAGLGDSTSEDESPLPPPPQKSTPTPQPTPQQFNITKLILTSTQKEFKQIIGIPLTKLPLVVEPTEFNNGSKNQNIFDTLLFNFYSKELLSYNYDLLLKNIISFSHRISREIHFQHQNDTILQLNQIVSKKDDELSKLREILRQTQETLSQKEELLSKLVQNNQYNHNSHGDNGNNNHIDKYDSFNDDNSGYNDQNDMFENQDEFIPQKTHSQDAYTNNNVMNKTIPQTSQVSVSQHREARGAKKALMWKKTQLKKNTRNHDTSDEDIF
jgi:uncharacterized coiled-coil protein SlyX